MSNTRRPRSVKAVKAVPPAPAPTEGEEQTQQDNQKVRNVSQTSIIQALEGLISEKDQRIRELESRVVMLNAVINSQDDEITALKNPSEEKEEKAE